MTVPQPTHIFLDESGDAGFQMDRGSSRIFSIAGIIFNSQEDISATEQVIAEIRRSLRLKSSHEFHFSNEPQNIREAFCSAITGCPFTIRAIVVDKEMVTSTHMRRSPKHFMASSQKCYCVTVLDRLRTRAFALAERQMRN